MAITRIFEAHAETGVGTHLFAWDKVGSNAVISSTKAKSGTYSYRTSGSNEFAKFIPTTSQLRGSFHINHNGGSSNPTVFVLYNNGTTIIRLTFTPLTATFTLLIGNTSVATIISAAFGVVDTWRHCTFDVKIDVAGWFNFYLDGVLILSYTGNTATAGSTINNFTFTDTATWGNYVYLDDIYLDDSTGELSPVLAPDRRFTYFLPSGNGASSQFMGSDGNQVSNYLLVDEKPTDNDSTYVVASSSGLRDLYDTAAFTLSAGWSIIAVNSTVIARKTDGAIATTLKLLSKNGASETLSVAKDLPTSYGQLNDRQLLQPNGTAWTEAAVNATEFGYESAGVF